MVIAMVTIAVLAYLYFGGKISSVEGEGEREGEREGPVEDTSLTLSVSVLDTFGTLEPKSTGEFVGITGETEVQLLFTANRDGFLYLIEETPENEIALVLPGPMSPGRIKAGEVFRMPPTGSTGYEGPPGKLKYRAILSLEMPAELEPIKVRFSAKFDDGMDELVKNPEVRGEIDGALSKIESRIIGKRETIPSERDTLYRAGGDVLIATFGLEYKRAQQ